MAERAGNVPEYGPYILRDLLAEIPLQGDRTPDEVYITYVEHWDGNLYIGTSASELLHLVALPGSHEHEPPTFILASRLQPSGHDASPPVGLSTGVQKIIVLPGLMRACVLCNGVVSFYNLPELSPAPGKEPTGIQWIGGFDENLAIDNSNDHVIMMATARRIMLVRIADRLRSVGNVDYPGCLRSSRRETIACVANGTEYALLEVVDQQQIPLVPISSIRPEPEVLPEPGHHPSHGGHTRSTSLASPPPSTSFSTSPGGHGSHLEVAKTDQIVPASGDRDAQMLGNRPRSSTDVSARSPSRTTVTHLKPHILSPTPSEFMLTTGTVKSEIGVGVFFNLDGDPSRGAIEFERYPDDVLVHNFQEDAAPSEDENLSILALIDKTDTSQGGIGIEVQGISQQVPKCWIPFPTRPEKGVSGLHKCLSPAMHIFAEVMQLLKSVRYKPNLPNSGPETDPRTQASIRRLEQETALFDDQSPRTASPTMEYEQTRNEEEKMFVARLGHTRSQAIAWAGQDLWLILPCPILLRLEGMLLRCGLPERGTCAFGAIDVAKILSLLGSIKEQEPNNEIEFWTLKYIRQKASLALFLSLQSSLTAEADIESASQIVRNALQEGAVDPRVILLLIPPLAREVIQGPNGIWLQAGIVGLLDDFKPVATRFQDAPLSFWHMIRQFLSDWQEKRGYGSITDEKYVFDSVDAAILHVLLYLDQALPEGSGIQTATRSKLNNVIDYWKGDFHRAIILLEHYKRLFCLSRLYQSRKLAKDVLATWRRIVEGEQDEDKSLTIEFVELQIRRYLTKISNTSLVQEYGLWLAQRNPDLAIQVFTDDSSRVKLLPEQVSTMLKEKAPGAVQQYLEHLVFGKNMNQYADDLIGYYLDSILKVLASSEPARESLRQSYAAYRALQAPKPTYLNFIVDNVPPQPWWQYRLRLLQLLGIGGYAANTTTSNALSYSVEKVLEKVTPFSSYLVSESIILDARQGRHEEALRLLIHGLGDYDTAVRYCYFGGPAPATSSSIDASMLPSKTFQQQLFTFLFHEFMKIENPEESIDQTSRLLGTFAPWFDPLTIFSDIPANWTIEMLSEFLLRSLRAATSEKNEAIILRALCAAQYLQKQIDHIDLVEKLGPNVEVSVNDTSVDDPTA